MTEPGVEIAVLGPLQVTGLTHPFRRSAAQELVVYLAFHRDGARTDVWSEALWPTRAVSPSTLHSTVSDARRSLGRGVDGAEHLPRLGRRLRLSPTVTTDVQRFAELASRADPDAWKHALTLVRGAPFDGLLLSDWTVFDGTLAQLESMVAVTALKGARHCMALGKGDDAEWMVRQALRVSPYDERLYRALLRAAHAQGNRAGLRSTMAHLRVLAGAADERGADPLECAPTWIHPRTEALYRELTRESVPASRGSFPRL
jgi:DNA-binding SARP family transcriptional activator